jgi:hypothetical protein
MRGGAAVGRLFPPQVWRKASIPLLWLIQRAPEHRPELAPEDRADLIDYFAEDITLLGGADRMGSGRLAYLPGGRDVLGPQIVGPVEAAGLVVETKPAVGNRTPDR